MTIAILFFTLTNFFMGVIATLAIVAHESGIIEENSAIICVGITLVAFVTLACSGAMLSLMCDSSRKERDRLSASWLSTLEKNRELQQELEKMRIEGNKQMMSKEDQIEVITYEQDRLYFFVDQVSLAQKKYDRLFKTFKDAPYLSEGAQFLSDAGRELQFYKDVVEMLDKGYRKQSEWISVEDRLPEFEHWQTIVDVPFPIPTPIKVLCAFQTKDGYIIREGTYEINDGLPYFRVNGRVAGIVGITHWMPLPEAPKMKGGAE